MFLWFSGKAFILALLPFLCRETWKHLSGTADIWLNWTDAGANSSCNKVASVWKDGIETANYSRKTQLFPWIQSVKPKSLLLMLHFWMTLSVPYVSSLSLQCQGVGGIIIVTIVTSFMVVYNSSSDTSSSLISHRVAETAPSKKQPKGGFTLEGYTRVVDHQVNQHLLFISVSKSTN